MKKVLSIILAIFVMVSFIPSAANVNAATKKKQVKKPAKVASVRLINPVMSGKKSTSMTLKWKKSKNARSYQVYRHNGKWKKYKKTKKRAISVGKLSYGKVYKFKVRAINGKRKGKFSKVAKVTVKKDGKVAVVDSAGKSEKKPVGEGYKLIKLAKQHVGGKYQSGGSHLKDPKKKGDVNKLDCTGFVQQIFSKYANISLPGGSHSKMIKAALKIGKNIKSMEQAQMGDIVFYKLGKNKNLQHVAICAGNGKVIDASRGMNGVYVHDQYNNKPIRIVRVLKSGGARQVLTPEERTLLEIEKADARLNNYYKNKGIGVPSSDYSLKQFYLKNKNLIEYFDLSKKLNVSINLKSKVRNKRTTYMKKLVLPAKPQMTTDNNGNVEMTGNIENYYRLLISMGWLLTGNYGFDDITYNVYGIKSITIKGNETFVNVNTGKGETRQIVYRDDVPVRSYYGCKEGDKYLLTDSGYPMTVKYKNTNDDINTEGFGIGIWEVGKPLPIKYDFEGELEENYRYEGYRMGGGYIYDGSYMELYLDKYKKPNQKEHVKLQYVSLEKYDEGKIKKEYENAKKILGSTFTCMDGTKISSYDDFVNMCKTGMQPYDNSSKKLFESLKQSSNGYYSTIR